MPTIRADDFLWYSLLIVLVLAPLPSGAVHEYAQGLLAFALYFLLAIRVTHPNSARTTWSSAVQNRLRLVMTCWLLGVAFALVQAIPLPAVLISTVSPAVADLYGWALPPTHDGTVWRPLSTTPAATLQTAVLSGAYAAAFYLVVVLCRSRGRMLTLAAAIVAVGAAEALYGIAHGGGSLTSPATGTFVSRNHFAALLAMALAVGVGLLLARSQEDRDARKGEDYPTLATKLDRWARLGPLTLALLTILAGGLFSLSRLGLLAPAFLAVSFALVWSVGSVSYRIRALVLGLGLAGVVLLTGAWPAFQGLTDRFKALEESYRLAAWKGTWALFLSSPFVGTGLGSLMDNLPRFLPVPIKEVFTHTHNEPLQVLAEGGLICAALWAIGLTAYFATVFSACLTRGDPWARGLGWGCLTGAVAVFLYSLLEFPLRMPANALYLSVILALGWVATQHRPQTSPEPGEQPATSLSIVSRLCLLLLAICGMGLSGVATAGDLLDRRGEALLAQAAETSAVENKNALRHQAEQLYSQADRLEPWQPAHAYRLGRLYETTAAALSPLSNAAQSAWTSAADYYRQAAEAQPAGARVQAALAWAALQSGDASGSRHAAETALRLVPDDAHVRFTITKWFLVQWENLSPDDRNRAVALVRRGATEMPEEYVKTAWQLLREVQTLRRMLPQDVQVRKHFMALLTAEHRFTDRWQEQATYSPLETMPPDEGVHVLSYGLLTERDVLPQGTVLGSVWSGMTHGWLSSGSTASSKIELPHGESVVFIPMKGEPAGGVWPKVTVAVGGATASFEIPPEERWQVFFMLLTSAGGTFPHYAVLLNGVVVQENGGFVERRATLGPTKLSRPPH